MQTRIPYMVNKATKSVFSKASKSNYGMKKSVYSPLNVVI